MTLDGLFAIAGDSPSASPGRRRQSFPVPVALYSDGAGTYQFGVCEVSDRTSKSLSHNQLERSNARSQRFRHEWRVLLQIKILFTLSKICEH